MRISKVKLCKSFYWNNEEVRKFKLDCKLYGMHEGRPKSDLLDAINTRRRYLPYRGGSSLTIGGKRSVKGKTKCAYRI